MIAVALILEIETGQMRRDAETRFALEEFLRTRLGALLISKLRMGRGQKRPLVDVERGNSVQRLSSLGIASGEEISARKMTPEPFRVIGIKAHCLLHPADPLLGLSLPSEDFPLLHDD